MIWGVFPLFLETPICFQWQPTKTIPCLWVTFDSQPARWYIERTRVAASYLATWFRTWTWSNRSKGTQQTSWNTNSYYVYIPRYSMYGIFTYCYHKNWPNVGKYTIHWASGIYIYIFIMNNYTTLEYNSITLIFAPSPSLGHCQGYWWVWITLNSTNGG